MKRVLKQDRKEEEKEKKKLKINKQQDFLIKDSLEENFLNSLEKFLKEMANEAEDIVISRTQTELSFAEHSTKA